ncbi:MAG: hypothetical protein U5L96_11365 [Owenweeksia sp.]|nr:hypothetical protein [Owenweeksia sp.]
MTSWSWSAPPGLLVIPVVSTISNDEVQALPEEANQTRSKDRLTVSLSEAGQGNTARLQLQYIDSMTCFSVKCRFADTLTLDSVNYRNVYYLANDSLAPALYINQADGLVGF